MKHLLSLVLAVILVGGLATEALGVPPDCDSYFGGCYVAATYFAGDNMTAWYSYCDDGNFYYGFVGGDQTAAICGA